MNVHFLSKRDDWRTPKDLFYKLNQEFHFDTDCCASLENALCPNFYSKERDFLHWTPYHEILKVGYMNPPYGRKIGLFVRQAYECAFVHGKTIVCLLPARTDTRWWHDYVVKAKEVRFLKGRLKFDGHKNNAPFPSCIVVFNGKVANDG